MKKSLSRRTILKMSSLPFFGFSKNNIFNSNNIIGNQKESLSGDLNIYWGDIHNHGNVGYAKGSLERAFEIAESHLDFYAFTPHSQWHDMPMMESNKHMNWVNGFKATKEHWSDVQKFSADYNKKGEFVTFPAYEWHSSFYGDYHLIFPFDNPPLKILMNIEALKKFAKEKGIIMIPHHPGYKTGRRGANFNYLDIELSPILEIYSEHGNAEKENAPFPYIRHSMGGVWKENTLQYALKSGHRFGVIASTDDHLGYPGAYGEGLAAVLAPELTRGEIFNALKKKRTYGVTGDRIELDFKLNGNIMGESIPFSGKREITVNTTGWDKIEKVEIVKNNNVIHRDFPIDRKISSSCWNKPVLMRIEFGWGPWAALELARVCEWEMKIEISGGVINDIQPCFQSGPYEESRRNLIYERTKSSCKVKSYTSRSQAFAEIPTNAVVLNISGNPDTKVSVSLVKPDEIQINKRLKELAEKNDVIFTGPFPDESIILHSLVFAEHYKTEFAITDNETSGSVDWYYIRVKQENGQLAWSSPIWVEKS